MKIWEKLNEAEQNLLQASPVIYNLIGFAIAVLMVGTIALLFWITGG